MLYIYIPSCRPSKTNDYLHIIDVLIKSLEPDNTTGNGDSCIVCNMKFVWGEMSTHQSRAPVKLARFPCKSIKRSWGCFAFRVHKVLIARNMNSMHSASTTTCPRLTLLHLVPTMTSFSDSHCEANTLSISPRFSLLSRRQRGRLRASPLPVSSDGI